MQGFDTIPVTVPQDPNISTRFGDPKSGPDKRMTNQHNTAISTVSVIRSPSAGTYELDVYHNSFAANPVDPEWLRQPGIRHWKIPEGSTSSLTSLYKRDRFRLQLAPLNTAFHHLVDIKLRDRGTDRGMNLRHQIT